jgi:uncharacterized protein (TIGR03792 family)
MVIEFLTFTVPIEKRAAFLARDAEVWTAALALQAGYVNKEVWVGAADPTQVTCVIRWESLAHWKRFPESRQKELDDQMGDLLMPVRSCCAFDVAVIPGTD